MIHDTTAVYSSRPMLHPSCRPLTWRYSTSISAAAPLPARPQSTVHSPHVCHAHHTPPWAQGAPPTNSRQAIATSPNSIRLARYQTHTVVRLAIQ